MRQALLCHKECAQMQGYHPIQEVRQHHTIHATLVLILLVLMFPIVLRQNQGMLWYRVRAYQCYMLLSCYPDKGK